jgi:molybdopterin adenylyltransferase
MRVAILTVSDRSARGEREDGTGPAIAARFDDVVETMIVPDETSEIETVLRKWCDEGICDLVITNGGTGLGPRDVTPEATKAVIERDVPGLPEMMRAKSPTSFAYLSRQVAGTRNGVLIVNVPGSPRAAVECLDAIADVLPHALEMLR